MINFNYETEFHLINELELTRWISMVIEEEGYTLNEINYIFCSDNYLYKLNVEFLNHDTLTDIISFDYSVGKILHGDLFISVERVTDNASDYMVNITDELHRVIVHGVLHLCGYKDKTEEEEKSMRSKENHYLNLLSNIS